MGPNQTNADERNKTLSPFDPFFAQFIFQLSLFVIARPDCIVKCRLDSCTGYEETAKSMPVIATYH